MSDDNLFNTTTQEAAQLAMALDEIKNLLRDVQRKVANIESRAKRAFPTAFPKQPLRTTGVTQLEPEPPTMSEPQLMQLYDQVVALAREQGRGQASVRLNQLGIGDLNLLRKELGISIGRRKPSKDTLLKTILGRVNESVMLTKHTNRQELIHRTQETAPPTPGEKECHR